MKPSDIKKVEDLTQLLADKQEEVMEAMIARNGTDGEAYGVIVKDAARAVVVLQHFCSEEPQEVKDIFDHAIVCVMINCVCRYCELKGAVPPPPGPLVDPMFKDLLQDIRIYISCTYGSVKIEGDEEE